MVWRLAAAGAQTARIARARVVGVAGLGELPAPWSRAQARGDVGAVTAISGERTIAQLVDELVAAWNGHDARRLRALCAPDYEGRDSGEAGVQRGAPAVEAAVARYLHAFPDLRITAERVVIQGACAAVVWTARGTHRGTLLHIPPTGRAVTVTGMSLLTVQGGRIARALHVWDVAGLLRTLGLLPEL